MGRATSGDLNRTSNGFQKYIFASNPTSGKAPAAFGGTQSSIIPAPSLEESKSRLPKKQQETETADEIEKDEEDEVIDIAETVFLRMVEKI